MLPEIPLAILLIILAVILIYAVYANNYTIDLPIEALTISASFTGIIVGFIVVFAMQKYDQRASTMRQFQRRIKELSQIILHYKPSLLPDLIAYVKSFLDPNRAPAQLLRLQLQLLHQLEDCHREELGWSSWQSHHFPLEQQLMEAEVKGLIAKLQELEAARDNQVNEIPNVIWYVAFIAVIIVSIFVALDERLSPALSVLAIVVIWLPISVIYYLYITRNGLDEELVACLIERLKLTC